jgi:hypothetical protein
MLFLLNLWPLYSYVAITHLLLRIHDCDTLQLSWNWTELPSERYFKSKENMNEIIGKTLVRFSKKNLIHLE